MLYGNYFRSVLNANMVSCNCWFYQRVVEISGCVFGTAPASFRSCVTTSCSNSLTDCSGHCLSSSKGTRDWWTGVCSCCFIWFDLSYPPIGNCSGGRPRLRNMFWSILRTDNAFKHKMPLWSKQQPPKFHKHKWRNNPTNRQKGFVTRQT